MKTKFKLSNRILSLLLAFVMVLGLLSKTSITVHAAADYDVDVTVNHHNYRITVTWFERVDVNEYAEGGGSTQVYPYYGNITSIVCTGFSETENEIRFDLTVFYKTVGSMREYFTVSIDKGPCGEAIDKTITVANGPTNKNHWSGKFQITRSAYSHQGDATCVTAANCTVCGESYINANNHNTTGDWLWENDTHYKNCGYGCGNRTEVTACAYSTATCVAASTCAVCGHEKRGIDPNAHSWAQWTGNGNDTHSRICTLDNSHTENGNCSGGTATCTDKAACDVCGQQYGVTLAHSTDEADDRAATCTEPAYCSVCGREYGMALGHSTDKADDRAATCTEPAYCSVCGQEYGEALGHSTGKAGDRVATHTARGYCSVCQQEYGEVNPDAHEYSNGFCNCGAYEPAADFNNDGRYEISNAGQLYWFAAVVNTGYGDVKQDTDACAELTADIVVNENVLKEDGSVNGEGSSFRPWTPIGDYYAFAGEFDGKGHTISGLYCDYRDKNGIGLFGSVNFGVLIQNLGVINSYVCGKENVGAIVGEVSNNSRIMNCFNTGTVTGDCVGGIAGWCERSSIDNCYNTGNIIGITPGRTGFGGVVGYLYNAASVTNSFSVGNVTCGSSKAGVIGARYNSNFSNCFFLNTGTSKYGTDMSAEQFASGEVAYLLNGSTSEGDLVWGQTIGTQRHPVLGGAKVYRGYDSCGGSGYTNNANALAEKPDHILTYTAEDNVITVSCAANCGYTDTATIIAESKTYDGAAVEVIVSKTGALENVDIPVTLTKNGEAFTDAPANAGDYTASITLNEKTASVNFTIAKAAYNMTGAKWKYTEPFPYDGKEHKVEVVGLPAGVTVASYENNTAVAVGDYYAEVNLAYDANNYIAPAIHKLGWTIYNDWTPTEYTVSTPNGNGWLNQDFVISAKVGYRISLTNIADGEWNESLTYSAETDDGSVTFYLKDEEGGAISLAETVSYKIDKTAPAGKVEFVDRTSWEEFLNTITFDLLYKDEVTVKITAADNLADGVKIEYYESDEAMTLTEVEAIADWTEYNGGFGVPLEDTKKFVYFVRLTDKAGNVTYLSTDGAEYDTTAPVMEGIEPGKTYYTTQKVTVTDKNIDRITLNGETAGNEIALEGNKETSYTIVATDKAGNTAAVTVTMKPIKELAKATEDLTHDNVTSADAPALKELVEKLDELIADPDTSDDGERETLEQHKHIAESLLETIEDAAKASNTENTEKVKDITAENVTPEDKTDLEKAKADLEKALEDHGDNYTEEEKKAIEDEIKRIDGALEVIGNVEAVEELIDKLPENFTKNDEDAIKAADDAYHALSDYEKSLVDEAVKKALEDAKAALAELNKPSNSPATGDNSNWFLWIALLFISGGAGITLTVVDRKRRTVRKR